MARGTERSASDFEKTFKDFQTRVERLQEIYNETNALFKQLNIADDHCILPQEREYIQRVLKNKPTVTIIGQTNSGKSSLANEILGGTVLPTAEVPCTSRIVRLKYSEDLCMSITDIKGEVHPIPLTATDRIPRSAVVLKGTDRHNQEKINDIVELGYNHPLLKTGISIVDAPGFSENEAIDRLVQQNVDGVLQLVMYVIDGNYSVRQKDRTFLQRLRRNAPSVRVVFVCNKTEVDLESLEMDRPSDESDSEEHGNETVNKAAMTFKDLVREALIDNDQQLRTCSYFHGLSTREIKAAREQGISNEYTVNFNNFKTDFLRHANDCFNHHLIKALESMIVIQSRWFTCFALSKLPEFVDIQHYVQEILQREERYFKSMLKYVDDNQETIKSAVAQSLSDHTDEIIEHCKKMPFDQIKIGQKVEFDEIIKQCRSQIQNCVIMWVLHWAKSSMYSSVHLISRHLKEQLARTLQDTAKDFGQIALTTGLMGILQDMQICYDHYITFGGVHFDVRGFYTENSLWKDMKSVAKYCYTMVVGTQLNQKWKGDEAKRFLKSVRPDMLSIPMIDAVKNQINWGHQHFSESVQKLSYIYHAYQMQTEKNMNMSESLAQQIAQQLCSSRGLRCASINRYVELPKSNDSILYKNDEVTLYALDSELVCKLYTNRQNERVLPKRIAHHLAKIRIFPLHEDPYVLDYVDISLTAHEYHPVVILPRMRTDLYTEIKTGSILGSMTLREKVNLVANILKGYQYLQNLDILVELKPSNILIGGGSSESVKINITKPPEFKPKYANGELAIHLPPTLRDHQGNIPPRDIAAYTLSSILWFLSIKKFELPNEANISEFKDQFGTQELREVAGGIAILNLDFNDFCCKLNKLRDML